MKHVFSPYLIGKQCKRAVLSFFPSLARFGNRVSSNGVLSDWEINFYCAGMAETATFTVCGNFGRISDVSDSAPHKIIFSIVC
jgi:hypothetical protein